MSSVRRARSRTAVVACVLVVLGVAAVAWATIATIERDAPPDVASAFRPPLTTVACGSLLDQAGPYPDRPPFTDESVQAQWIEVLASVDEACQDARRPRQAVVVLGLASLAIGGWVGTRDRRSTASPALDGDRLPLPPA